MQFKKTLATLLAFAVCVPMASAIPNLDTITTIEVSAETKTTEDGLEYVTNTSQGYVAITGYTGSDIDIVIPSEIDGYPVTTVGNNAFSGDLDDSNNWKNNQNIQSVTIPDTVTTIGEYTFFRCYSLTSVNIPSSVTTIGKYAFWDCQSLKTVTLNNGLITIGSSAFANCKLLTSITIPSTVTTMDYGAFQYCTALKSIVIPSSVTSLGSNVFYNCTALESITILDSVTSIGSGTFEGCTALKEVTIPSSVTRIGYGAFKNCTNLETVTIKSTNTQIDDTAFDGCYIVNIVYDYEDEPVVTTDTERQSIPTVYTATLQGQLVNTGFWDGNASTVQVTGDGDYSLSLTYTGEKDTVNVNNCCLMLILDFNIWDVSEKGNLSETGIVIDITSVDCDGTSLNYFGTSSNEKAYRINDDGSTIRHNIFNVWGSRQETKDIDVPFSVTDGSVVTVNFTISGLDDAIHKAKVLAGNITEDGIDITEVTTAPVTTITRERYNNAINGVYGDVNGDGKVNVIDLLIVKKIVLGIDVYDNTMAEVTTTTEPVVTTTEATTTTTEHYCVQTSPY